ncbi:MAG: F0F1 ATP synthase subunit alpha, partial [Solobacterium sp.]|nr:F0F1 ATP synthase subunit alpha [Solobacterium sp.]
KKVIEHGSRITELLKQPQYQPMSVEEQVISMYAVRNNFIDEIDVDDIRAFERFMHRFFKDQHPDILKEIVEAGDISGELNDEIKAAMREAVDQFKLTRGA